MRPRRRVRQFAGANRVVVALSVARFTDGLGDSILYIVLPLYVAALPASRFNLPTPVAVGLLFALFGIVSAGAQPVIGLLIDRLGRLKVFIQSGLIVMGASTLTFLVAHRFVDLLLLRLLQGVGVAMTIPATLALMTAATEKETRGEAMGIYGTLRILGVAAGPLIGGALQVRFGFNAAFFIAAGFVGLSLLLVHRWVEEPRPNRRLVADERSAPSGEPRFVAALLALGAATFLMAGAFAMITTLQEQFNARLHQSVLGFSIAFSAFTFSRVVGMMPLGRLSDRIGRKPVILAGLCLLAPTTALLAQADTMLQFTLLRGFQGLASGGIAGPALALAAELSSGSDQGRHLSIITMGFGLGLAIGPLGAGLLAVWFFELPFYVFGTLLLVGAWAILHYVPETLPARHTPRATLPGV